jgi:iron complex outermembrane recepter protein
MIASEPVPPDLPPTARGGRRHADRLDMRFTLPVLHVCLISCVAAAPAAAGGDAATVAAEARPAPGDRKHFRIAAADAAVSLEVFADQAGVAVIFLVEQVRGVQTNAIDGHYTPREAVVRLVANSPLTVAYDARTGALMVKRAAPPARPGPPSRAREADSQPQTSRPMTSKNLLAFVGGWLLASLPAQAQSAPAAPAVQDQAPINLPTFEVRTDKDEGYLSTQTTSGSRTVEMLRDVPASISVLNRQLMDDLNITTIDELSEYAVTGHISDDTEGTQPVYVFRGLNANARLRDGVKSYGYVDSFSVERVEALRGSSAFIYGEGSPGGAMNQLSKAAQPTNFQRLNLMVGSYDLRRLEFDINRRINDRFAVRFNLAYQDANSFVNHTKRKFKGGQFSFSYRPFKNTDVLASIERTSTRATRADGILADAFSNTERAGTTVAYTATTGGKTFIPALGQIYNMSAAPAQRRSSGTNTAVFDQGILPRGANYWGPNSHHNMDSVNVNVRVAQRIGENLRLQASWSHYEILRDTRTNAGSSSAGIYLDRNPTLPGGVPNPYFNEYYTEYYVTRLQHRQLTADARITAVYDLNLPFTQQKVIATALEQYDMPDRQFYRMSEFVDPSSPLFAGSLVNADTLLSYRANNSTLGANRFYRRFYLKDGDGAHLTHNALVPGQSVMLYDSANDGTNGRLSNRKFDTPAVSLGLSGAYFGGRLRTLIGARRDWFYQTTFRNLYNHVTDDEFPHPDPLAVRVINDVKHNSRNGGAVFHVAHFLAATVNFSESQNVSSGTGNTLIPGLTRGRSKGDTLDYGLRWTFLGGRLETNWTYFTTTGRNGGASPTVPVAVRNELAQYFDINTSGNDKHATQSQGVELETIANINRNWRLMWNFSTSELQATDRYPQLKAFQAEARSKNLPTPETDAFLPTVPEGTPRPGYTKYTSNLVTSYRFSEGRLKGVTVGGGFQYRDKTYRGNFDFDRDGVAEMTYTPAYFLANLTLGYRARIMDRNATFNLNVNNVFDKEYFKSRSIGSGSWGDGRNFRFSIRTEL